MIASLSSSSSGLRCETHLASSSTRGYWRCGSWKLGFGSFQMRAISRTCVSGKEIYPRKHDLAVGARKEGSMTVCRKGRRRNRQSNRTVPVASLGVSKIRKGGGLQVTSGLGIFRYLRSLELSGLQFEYRLLQQRDRLSIFSSHSLLGTEDSEGLHMNTMEDYCP